MANAADQTPQPAPAPDPECQQFEKVDPTPLLTFTIPAPDWHGAGGPDRTWQLTPKYLGELKRTPTQQKALQAAIAKTGAPQGDPLFGKTDEPHDDDLDWSCRKYKFEIRGIGAPEKPPPDCFLFNVIVALEWIPSAAYLRQLRRGLQRASELLYDVTEGQMAFGKVIIGDESWLDCADIQVMANNRILPRSWTGGLICDKKYMPIRVGRGLRARDRHEILMWDEADAYHTLVHEWLHYAVLLRDEYLAPQQKFHSPPDSSSRFGQDMVLPFGGFGNLSIMATPVGHSELSGQLRRSQAEQIALATHADLLKTDTELRKAAYHGLQLAQDRDSQPAQGATPPDPGPYLLPLPLPIFRLAGALPDGGPLDQAISIPEYLLLAENPPVDCQLLLPGDMQAPPSNDEQPPFGTVSSEDAAWFARWEISVLRPRPGATAEPYFERVIAQGILDATARNIDRTFALCGAEPNDTVLIIGHDLGDDDREAHTRNPIGVNFDVPHDDRPLGARFAFFETYAAPIKAAADTPRSATSAATTGGKPGTAEIGDDPQDLGKVIRPLVDVFPDNPVPQDPALRRIPLHEALFGNDERWDSHLYYQAEHRNPDQGPDARPIALDGQVVLSKTVGDKRVHLVCNFSRGGVPTTWSSTPPNPLSAGSADGGALILGNSNNIAKYPTYLEAISKTITITTSIPWLPDDNPVIKGLEYLPARPLTNVFSITANRSLDFSDVLKPIKDNLPSNVAAQVMDDLTPTLAIFFEPSGLRRGEVPVVCCQDQDNTFGPNTWFPVASRGSGLVRAMQLISQTAPHLFVDPPANGWLVDRYCLFGLQIVDRHRQPGHYSLEPDVRKWFDVGAFSAKSPDTKSVLASSVYSRRRTARSKVSRPASQQR